MLEHTHMGWRMCATCHPTLHPPNPLQGSSCRTQTARWVSNGSERRMLGSTPAPPAISEAASTPQLLSGSSVRLTHTHSHTPTHTHVHTHTHTLDHRDYSQMHSGLKSLEFRPSPSKQSAHLSDFDCSWTWCATAALQMKLSDFLDVLWSEWII